MRMRHSKPDKYLACPVSGPYLFIYSNMKYRAMARRYARENNGHCDIPEAVMTVTQYPQCHNDVK